MLTYRLDKGDEALKGLEKAEQAASGDPAKLGLVLDARARALRRLHRPGPLADTLAARRALAKTAKPVARKKGTPHPHVLVLREEAHLRAFSLDELGKARDLLDEARKIAGDEPPILADLLRVERRASGGDKKNLDRLLELLEAAAKVEPNPKKKADFLVEAGRAAKVRKNDAAKAKALFTAALGIEATRLEAMRWLQALAQEKKDEDELASWLGKEAEIETDPRRRSLVHARLGDCHRRRGKDDAARKSDEAALADDPNHPLALRHLAPLLRRAKDWPRLASVLERLARVEPDKHARRERLVMLGEVRLRKQGDKKGARAAFDEALALEADDLAALRGRTRTLDPKKEAKELVETLGKELRLTPSAARRADLHKLIGELRFERLNDLDGASKAFQRRDPHQARRRRRARLPAPGLHGRQGLAAARQVVRRRRPPRDGPRAQGGALPPGGARPAPPPERDRQGDLALPRDPRPRRPRVPRDLDPAQAPREQAGRAARGHREDPGHRPGLAAGDGRAPRARRAS